jgi:hypothetical protein
MATGNRGEIIENNEFDEKEMDPTNDLGGSEDFAEIEEADQADQEELDFADEVFIDNFEYLPPDDE